MGFKSSYLLCLALFLAISSSIHAFDITKLLNQYPDFATFNKYLTETKLVSQINSRNTITVLAVNDAGLSAISGKSQDAIQAIMSTHVVLDYFDEKKLVEAQGSGQPLTTLYQSTGRAVNNQGFIKVKLIGEGELAFGSAVSGAPVDVELVKTVVTQPYNISILQVAKPIIFPGLDSRTPVGAKGAKAPTKSAQAPQADEVAAPSPSEVVTDSPTEAPTADASSPSLAPGPGAAADAESSSSRTIVGLVGAMMCFASFLVVM